MIYSKYITTPANTSEKLPKRTVLKVTKGLVYKVEIMFPPGSAGLLRCAIFDGFYQAWPSTSGEYFRTEMETISYPDTYLKEAQPFQFDIITWNEDNTYDHALVVRLGMVSERVFMARFLPTYGWEEFEKMLKEIRAVQEFEIEMAKAKLLKEESELREQILTTPFPWMEKD